jgi:hypothetical protein
VSHAMLESDSLPHGKLKVSAYGAQPGDIGVVLNLWFAVLVEVLGSLGPMTFAARAIHERTLETEQAYLESGSKRS